MSFNLKIQINLRRMTSNLLHLYVKNKTLGKTCKFEEYIVN